MLKFNPDHILAIAQAIPEKAMVAFAIACAERLQPYAEFSDEPETVRLVRSILDAAFLYVSGSSGAAEQIQLLSEALEASPYVDDDAAASTAYVARSLLSGNPQNAVWAAQRAYDARDLEAQGALNSGLIGKHEEAILLAHPSVQLELQRQIIDLKELENSAEPASIVLRAKHV